MAKGALLQAEALAVGHRAVGRSVRRCLIDGLDASLVSGELVCLLGRNGAGKSTLLQTLGGLLPPLEGRVRALGRPLAESTPGQLARHLAMVLPERPAVDLLRVGELVALGRFPHTDWTGRLRSGDRLAVARALRQAGIEALAERTLDTLSDGECQRAMIARALAQEPEVLLLDEPTAHLDLPGRVEILSLLRRLAGREDGGRAILLSTHDLELALDLADRIWLLDRGRVIQGVPEDLLLGGALARAFDLGPPGEETPWERRVHAAGPPVGAVCLVGDGVGVRWTGQALERVGYQVLRDGASSLRVEVSSAPYRWILIDRGASERLLSIEDLLARLDLRRRD